MDTVFFMFIAGLSIIVLKLKYGLTGKSYKFYFYYLIFLIGLICIPILVNLIQNQFLRMFLWIPTIIFFYLIASWLVKYLENIKK